MRHVDDVERRRRLLRRHALAPGHRTSSPEATTRALVVLHSTEPATPYLSCRARQDDFVIGDLDRALETDRTVVKQLAMRRTLFVFPRDLLPAAWGSASARVAATEGARMAKDVAAAGLAPDGVAWLDRGRAEVMALLAAHPEGLPAAQIRERTPWIDVRLEESAGATWTASRVLTHLGLTADLVRATNTSHWRVSRPRWAPMAAWLDVVPEPLTSADGYRELVARWLRSFGPGTEDDVVWWLGATKGAVRAALRELDAVTVGLDGGATGYLLPDDVDPEPLPDGSANGPVATLLPVLDPTVMGWRGRDWYLGGHAPELFDRNGNAGTTAWVDGRVVGCWVQDVDGRVHLELLEEVAPAARAGLDAEAERLTAWLDGVRVSTVYPSAAMKRARERVGA